MAETIAVDCRQVDRRRAQPPWLRRRTRPVQESRMIRTSLGGALASNVGGPTLVFLFSCAFLLAPALALEQEAAPAEVVSGERAAEDLRSPDQLVLSSSERVLLVNHSLQQDEERLVQLTRDLVLSRQDFEDVGSELEKVSSQIETLRAELPSEPDGELAEEGAKKRRQ